MNTNETTKDKRLESHKNLIQYQVLRNGSISSFLFERIICVKLNNVFYFIIASISSSFTYAGQHALYRTRMKIMFYTGQHLLYRTRMKIMFYTGQFILDSTCCTVQE